MVAISGNSGNFFDLPRTHPDGTRSFQAEFNWRSARATSIGDRVEIAFEGMRMGIFEGSLRYVIFPGSRLIEQVAVMTTSQPDTAYFYDAGLGMTVNADRRVGGNMESYVSYYDTAGALKTMLSGGPERHPAAVRYRTLAARTGAGSVAVLPSPASIFLFARFHYQYELAVALGMEGSAFARHPAASGRCDSLLPMVQRAARNSAAHEHFCCSQRAILTPRSMM